MLVVINWLMNSDIICLQWRTQAAYAVNPRDKVSPLHFSHGQRNIKVHMKLRLKHHKPETTSQHNFWCRFIYFFNKLAKGSGALFSIIFFFFILVCPQFWQHTPKEAAVAIL